MQKATNYCQTSEGQRQRENYENSNLKYAQERIDINNYLFIRNNPGQKAAEWHIQSSEIKLELSKIEK
jgi:hypothetical protein